MSSSRNAWKLRISGRLGRFPIFGALIIFLAPTILACAFLAPNRSIVSDPAAAVTHLPTFTRTPLPTFTPTPSATVPAVARLEEPAYPEESTAAETAPGAANPVDQAETTSPSSEPENAVEVRQDNAGEADVSAEVPVAESAAAPPAAEAVAAPSPTPVVEAGAELPDPAAPVPPAATLPPTTAPAAATTAAPLPTETPAAIPTEAPAPTETPTPAPTSLPEGWVFSGVRVTSEPDGGSLLLYGDVTNNTGTVQELYFITGVFYDDQGQPIPDALTVDYWPIETVPQGGTVPFELTVIDVQSVGNFELGVDAVPSEDTPRQDFELSDLNQTNKDGDYCVSGKLRNPGDELQFYLAVVAVLYDGQDQVIGFSDHYNYSPETVVGDQTMDFEVCVDPNGQDVARHDLRVWGL